MAKTEQFLTLYKTYEGLLREHEKDYKSLEESAEDLLMNRMRITRQMRNYLSHNADPSFLVVSDLQIKLLEDLIRQEQMSVDTLKDHLYTPKRSSCTEGTPLKEVLAQMTKQKFEQMPVILNGRVLGIVTIYKVADVYLKNEQEVLNRKTYGAYGKNLVCLSPDTPMNDIISNIDNTEKVICCTEDGFLTGKFKGVYKEK